jgi:hypothetical protein
LKWYLFWYRDSTFKKQKGDINSSGKSEKKKKMEFQKCNTSSDAPLKRKPTSQQKK